MWLLPSTSHTADPRGYGPSCDNACREAVRNVHPAARNVSAVISGGIPRRSGSPSVPSPGLTYRKAHFRETSVVSSHGECAVGPHGRRYRPAANGVMRLAALHWRFPSFTRICPPWVWPARLSSMPNAAARGKVSGLCESKMLGMSDRTNPSMLRSREDGSPGRARSRWSSTPIRLTLLLDSRVLCDQ